MTKKVVPLNERKKVVPLKERNVTNFHTSGLCCLSSCYNEAVQQRRDYKETCLSSSLVVPLTGTQLYQSLSDCVTTKRFPVEQKHAGRIGKHLKNTKHITEERSGMSKATLHKRDFLFLVFSSIFRPCNVTNTAKTRTVEKISSERRKSLRRMEMGRVDRKEGYRKRAVRKTWTKRHQL